jgi:hypothetical protein
VLAVLAATPTVAGAQPRTRVKVAARDKPASADPSIAVPIVVEPIPAPPGVTLAAGTVLVHTAFEMSLSRDSAVAPASLAPDFSVGVTDDLTVALVESSSALTGFRGSAGAGFCLTGDGDGNCRKPYAGGGFETLYSLVRGDLALAANAGLLATAIEPLHVDLKLGVKMKLTRGTSYALFSPSIWYALNERYDRILPHKDQLWLPFSIWNKLTPSFALGVGSGFKGPLQGLATNWSAPLGVLMQYSFDPQISIGTSLVFGRVVGGSEVMDPGVDARAAQVWINVSSK